MMTLTEHLNHRWDATPPDRVDWTWLTQKDLEEIAALEAEAKRARLVVAAMTKFYEEHDVRIDNGLDVPAPILDWLNLAKEQKR